ncbi:uncharacterized protein LOC111697784 isoform X1 [Eurytemora carolleeae]|uniref:uncharacterized protein LOC111697784 isoform X1 n=1 Tax=Eurytemora carolleeae TaxID=1294199 RepID=UPI000C77F830|nr:uncharacterized protein LOC111697784 isoform X1 [Eurytemora carolleeae]|eukprot:XP_023323675.1 uncharacterized protein LOC111697784 isoform X1 [Eurytemora affinis]
MSSSIVYGDGLDDVKDCMLGVVTRRDRGEGCSCNRPVILGSILIIWLFSVSVALIVVASKYQNLSVVSLSSRLDQVDRLHLEKHSNTNSRIDTVSSQHRTTAEQLAQTADNLIELQSRLRESLSGLAGFLSDLGQVARDAGSQLNKIKNI